MTPEGSWNGPDAALDRIFADLGANVAAERLMASVKALEGASLSGAPLARLLHAKGIVLNRLGLPGEALGALHEARAAYAALDRRAEESTVWRSIAAVHGWRGDGRDASLALLQAVAAGEPSSLGPSLIEAGRLAYEIGRTQEARTLLERGLTRGGPDATERRRAEIVLVRVLIAADEPLRARSVAEALEADDGAASRIRFLAALELARIAGRIGDLEVAGDALANAARHLAPAAGSFEVAERAEVEAEMALARGDAAAAERLIAIAIARYAEDDLSGREVDARLVEATILDRLGRPDESAQTLSAALRRATAHGLVGRQDAIRHRLAERDVSTFGFLPGASVNVPSPSASSRFVRRRPLGAGGFGTVSRAYDLETGQEVALKNLGLATIYDVTARDRRLDGARREAAMAARIQHPGVGRVYGIFSDPDGETLLVRELVEGPSLRELGPTGPRERLAILAQLCQALAAVHAASVVHRDMKPENVILRDGRMPVIIDFGISTAGTERPRSPSFTAGYAAPEQMAGGAVDARADLFALATIAVEWFLGSLPERAPAGWLAVAGRRRWAADLRASLGPHLPADAIDPILATLAPRPASRRATAQDLALAFQQAL